MNEQQIQEIFEELEKAGMQPMLCDTPVPYFDKTIIDRIISLLNSGRTLRESYILIREKQPVAFQTALLRFVQENPEKTIYDT